MKARRWQIKAWVEAKGNFMNSVWNRDLSCRRGSPLSLLNKNPWKLNICINDSFVFLSTKIIFYCQWTFRFRKTPLIGSEKLWKCYISSPCKRQYLYILVLVGTLPNLTLLGQSILPFCTNVRLESI